MADLIGRFEGWLRSTHQFGPSCDLVSLEPLAGGQSSELLSLICRPAPGLPEQRFVIRKEQRGRQLFQAPDITREFDVIAGVAAHGSVPVAAMVAIETSGDVLGMPFLVMRHVDGRSPLGRPSMHRTGLLTELASVRRRAIAMNGIEAVARIHAVDWRRSHPFLGTGEGTGIDRHLQRIVDWYRWASAGRSFPVIEEALTYLVRHRPGLHPEDDVLLWGDARPGNILFHPDGTVAAVLDWENALVGPRSLDVGYWLMMDSFHAEMAGVEPLPGWPGQVEQLQRYRDAAQAEVHDLDYYVVLGAVFIAVTLIRTTDIDVAANRLPVGTTMAHRNTATQIIARTLGLPVLPLSEDFVVHRGLDPGFTGPIRD